MTSAGCGQHRLDKDIHGALPRNIFSAKRRGRGSRRVDAVRRSRFSAAPRHTAARRGERVARRLQHSAAGAAAPHTRHDRPVGPMMAWRQPWPVTDTVRTTSASTKGPQQPFNRRAPNPSLRHAGFSNADLIRAQPDRFKPEAGFERWRAQEIDMGNRLDPAARRIALPAIIGLSSDERRQRLPAPPSRGRAARSSQVFRSRRTRSSRDGECSTRAACQRLKGRKDFADSVPAARAETSIDRRSSASAASVAFIGRKRKAPCVEQKCSASRNSSSTPWRSAGTRRCFTVIDRRLEQQDQA